MLIAGCGFLGGAAAELFSKAGWNVLGLCSSRASSDAMGDKPFGIRAADIRQPLTLESGWHEVDLLIHCASSGGGGPGAYRAVYFDGLRHLLEAVRPRALAFVSSTSVYGQCDGRWVDENSPADPQTETGKILRETEDVALAAGGVVFRLAGLYGPGRSVLLRKYREGSARIESGGTRWINQIHRDDAANALFLAERLAAGIYNVCDDMPATQRTVYGWIARALGGALPGAVEIAGPRKRGNSDKRVSNARLRAAGWAPHFSSYRKALPGLLSHNA